MCGLFGFVHYGDIPINNLSALTKSLAEYSAVRGTDATGIAYVKNGIQIQKDGRSAYTMSFKHPDSVISLIGHTRHSTHGSHKKNYNNHPFHGKAGVTRFALAHNGVLWNDGVHLGLPKTKIETDSYIAVQLIEKQRTLTFDSIRDMAETVDGSFCFSILDDQNSLWLVKGDNPLSIIHFPKKQIYVYASTDEILYKALVDSPIFNDLRGGAFEEIELEEGQILKISRAGALEYSRFRYVDHFRPGWWEYGYYMDPPEAIDYYSQYLEALRTTAIYNGYDPDDVNALADSGYSLEEIEDLIYEI